MIRGIERRRIFHDTEDYEDFLTRLDRLVPELGVLVLTWVLMPNHAHFALQTGPVPLPRLMARLGTGYAVRFNHRHQRVGHLLQNRYQSRLVEDDRDLLGLVRYIHGNPLRAGLVPSAEALGSFPWCGYGALTGERPARPFEAPTATLRLLAEEPAEARRHLRHWMQQPLDPTDLAPGPPEEPPASRSRPNAGYPATPALTELIQAVCTAHGLPPEALGGGHRGHAVLEARCELARRATRDLGLPSRAVARALGVSESTMSRALKRSRRQRKLGDVP
jgi:REP element-mobilizing transposase RayT